MNILKHTTKYQPEHGVSSDSHVPAFPWDIPTDEARLRFEQDVIKVSELEQQSHCSLLSVVLNALSPRKSTAAHSDRKLVPIVKMFPFKASISPKEIEIKN